MACVLCIVRGARHTIRGAQCTRIVCFERLANRGVTLPPRRPRFSPSAPPRLRLDRYENTPSAEAAGGVLGTLLAPMMSHCAEAPQPFAGTLLWSKGSFAQVPGRSAPRLPS